VGERFSAPVQTCPGVQPASYTMGTGSVPGIKSGLCVTLTHHPPSSVVAHERVELYLYSLYESYGLYRASVELYLYSPYGPYGPYRASVELYLYSPYGPYGLYRASVSVQGCILPLVDAYWFFINLLLLCKSWVAGIKEHIIYLLQ
jgi:hypothetical protein